MPRKATERLTDRMVRALPSPTKGSTITYDAEIPGFGARITANGARAFILNYVIAGKERRLTIGQFPTWSTTAARDQARVFRRDVDAGIDPMEQRDAREAEIQAERAAPTMTDLFDRYAAEHLPRKAPRSAADDRSMWTKIILPRMGTAKVAAISPSDIDALHAEVSKTRPVRANRVVEVMRKAFNLAIRWGWRADNPATGVHRNHEEKRDRYLSADEVLRLSNALAEHKETTSANAIRLMMLTGARRGEVLGATWDMFDLETGVWTKPSAHTKQRKEHRVPISAPTIQLLREMKIHAEHAAEADGQSLSPFVFPNRAGGPISEIKRTWLTVCRAAGMARKVSRLNSNGGETVAWEATARIHDLRHTFASILASQGLSLPIIGALLGHTQVQTTGRYAHLLDDPLRAAAEKVGAAIAKTTPNQNKNRAPGIAPDKPLDVRAAGNAVEIS